MMPWIRKPLIATLLACICLSLVDAGLAQETKSADGTSAQGALPPSPPTPPQAEQLKVFHLKQADAAAVVKEISGRLKSDHFRIVADKRTNLIITLARPETQRTVQDMIARLDVPPLLTEVNAAAAPGDLAVPPPPSEVVAKPAPSEGDVPPPPSEVIAPPVADDVRTSPPIPGLPPSDAQTTDVDQGADQPTAIGALRVPNVNVDLLAKVINQLQQAKPADGAENNAVAVVKASPGVQRALAELMANLNGVPTSPGNSNPPLKNANVPVRDSRPANPVAYPRVPSNNPPAPSGPPVPGSNRRIPGSNPRGVGVPGASRNWPQSNGNDPQQARNLQQVTGSDTGSQPLGIRVLYIPGVEAAAVARALAGLSAGPGAKPNVIVVVPSQATEQQAENLAEKPSAVPR